MTITDEPLRRVAFYWSESDKQWCKLEVSTRHRVDDDWFTKTIRMSTLEIMKITRFVLEGYDR